LDNNHYCSETEREVLCQIIWESFWKKPSRSSSPWLKDFSLVRTVCQVCRKNSIFTKNLGWSPVSLFIWLSLIWQSQLFIEKEYQIERFVSEQASNRFIVKLMITFCVCKGHMTAEFLLEPV